MKLHAQTSSALNTVTAYGPGYIEVNRVRHAGHLLLLPDQPVRAWAVRGFDALLAGDLERLLALQPELVVLGTGPHHRLLAPALAAPLLRAGVGIESMDTGAACRTYNLLQSEGRMVLAALLQADPPGPPGVP